MIDVPDRQLVVLVANHAEWLGRSLESVIQTHGYGVLRVEDGRGAHDLAMHASPDAVILDAALPGMSGVQVCRRLSGSTTFDETVPIVITTPGPASHRERSEAYEAGAWEVCSSPIDPETLISKLERFVRARRRVQLMEAQSLIDPLTGLYSVAGLYQWAAKMAARASRCHEPIACVVVAPDRAPGPVFVTDALLSSMADFCRMHSRRSDVVGYMGDSRFAILAPETDAAGAQLMVERLQRAREGPSDAMPAVPSLRTGIYAVSDFASAGITPSEVVDRATAALLAQSVGDMPPGTERQSFTPLN